MPTAAQLSAAILGLNVNSFANRPSATDHAPLTLAVCAFCVGGLSLLFGDRLPSHELAPRAGFDVSWLPSEQLFAALPWADLPRRADFGFELIIHLLSLVLALLSLTVWRGRGHCAAGWVAALLTWTAAPTLFHPTAFSAEGSLVSLALVGAATSLVQYARLTEEAPAAATPKLCVGVALLCAVAAFNPRLGLTAGAFTLGALEPWTRLNTWQQVTHGQRRRIQLLVRLGFAWLSLFTIILTSNTPFKLGLQLDHLVTQWGPSASALSVPVTVAAGLAVLIKIIHPSPSDRRGRWPTLLFITTLVAASGPLPQLLCLAVLCASAAGLPAQLAKLCPDHPRTASILATLAGLTLVGTTARPLAQARWSVEPSVLTQHPGDAQGLLEIDIADSLESDDMEADALDVWEQLADSSPDAWTWDPSSAEHSAVTRHLRVPETTLPQDELGRAQGYRRRELDSLHVPGDVLITVDIASFHYWTQRQFIEGLRPDVQVLWAGDLRPATLLELAEGWATTGQRILSESFTLGGHWSPNWAVKHGVLFWFLFSDANPKNMQTPTSLTWPQHELDGRNAAEQARYLRHIGRPRESFTTLVLDRQDVARFQDAVQIAKAMAIPDSRGLEMHGQRLKQAMNQNTSATSNCAQGHAGDLLTSMGAMRRGVQLMDEAGDRGCVAALGAAARWRLRAGQQREAWLALARLKSLADNPAAYEELLTTWRWLLDHGRSDDANDLRLLIEHNESRETERGPAEDFPAPRAWLHLPARKPTEHAWRELGLRLRLATNPGL